MLICIGKKPAQVHELQLILTDLSCFICETMRRPADAHQTPPFCFFAIDVSTFQKLNFPVNIRRRKFSNRFSRLHLNPGLAFIVIYSIQLIKPLADF